MLKKKMKRIEIRIEQSKIYMKTTDNTTNIEVRTQTTF